MSSSVHFPESTCERLRSGRIPSMMSMLASPRSASNTMTRFPSIAMETAMLRETLDFPTPPLPPVTVMTLTLPLFVGAAACAFLRPSA